VSTVLVLAATLAVVAGFAYALGMYLERGLMADEPPGTSSPRLLFVYLVPCLNEAKVISQTLARLTDLPDASEMIVLVIDDASGDETLAIARGHPDERVHVMHRFLPEAQRGKGDALNAAVAHLLGSGLLEGWQADAIVVGLLDADGRLDPFTPTRVAPLFADPSVGAVQISVRINNRLAGLLTRLQDMEFVIFTAVFQVARTRLGIAGLGGNGQFTRLSALLDLGPAPWSDVLTEDLDLGVRMQLCGWSTVHCVSAEVHQQGLLSLRRLVRQRSRWFQGHLQCWRLVPSVVRGARGRIAAEMLHTLLMPCLVLLSSFMTLSFVATVVGVALTPAARAQILSPAPLLAWYLLTFAPGQLFGYVYARSVREVGVLRGMLLGHAFVLYGLVWMAAGWWAVGRMLTGHRSWLKTARDDEAQHLDRGEAPAGRASAPPTAGDASARAPAGQR